MVVEEHYQLDCILCAHMVLVKGDFERVCSSGWRSNRFVTVLPDGAGARQKEQLDNNLSPASLYRIRYEALRMAVRFAPSSFASRAGRSLEIALPTQS